jgi:hypothetical protein
MLGVPTSRLKSLESASTGSPDDIAYVAAAARVADAPTLDVLLAPIESSVIPLPHQIRALSCTIIAVAQRILENVFRKAPNLLMRCDQRLRKGGEES